MMMRSKARRLQGNQLRPSQQAVKLLTSGLFHQEIMQRRGVLLIILPPRIWGFGSFTLVLYIDVC